MGEPSFNVSSHRHTLGLSVLGGIAVEDTAHFGESLLRRAASLALRAPRHRERVIRLEERDNRVSTLESLVATLDAHVDVLLKDKDRHDGAVSFGQTLLKHLPALSLGGLIAALASWFAKSTH